MFYRSRDIQISGGTFTVNNPDPDSSTAARKGLELLHQKIAPGAFHNSDERYDPPRCHPQTRHAVLQEIMDWVEAKDRATRFMWIHGPVGAGKSAIEQTIAEMCHNAGILAASFFFSRNIAGRNDKSLLITTLAYQLTVSIPAIREHVGCVLNDDPHLLSRSLETQMLDLIINPLRRAITVQKVTAQAQPYVVILDGLDECGDADAQRYILRVLLIAAQLRSIPLIFLIASRPEQHLRDCFEDKILGPLTTRLVLDDKYHPDSDIRIFLASKFQDIKEMHPSRAHLPQLWPLEEDIDRLVEKSSGQFIYASTVMKFLYSPRHWPPDRLAIIFGIIPRGKSTPFAEMDALYLHILASADENLPNALEIISFLLLFRHEWLIPNPSFVASFLSYRRRELTLILSDLHSIIAVPTSPEDETPLHFYHASLGDCLLDHSRSGDNFFIDPGLGHKKIAMLIMENLTNPSGFTDVEKEIMRDTFPEHCLKSEPNDTFLETLYDLDLSACLCRLSNEVIFLNATTFFRWHLHPLKSYVRVPALLFWLRKQHLPHREDNLFHHHLLRSIDGWLSWELNAFSTFPNPYLSKVALAGVTLVDFPEFRDTYYIIPKILDWKLDYSPLYHGPKDVLSVFLSEDWEEYLWYRKLLADFLTDPARAQGQFVGSNEYVELAKYIWEFLLLGGNARGYTKDEIKVAMAFLPLIIAKIPRSIKLAKFLRKHPLELNPLFEEVQTLGEKYAFEVLGTPKWFPVRPPPSPTSSLSTISIPESPQEGSPGSTPRLLTPPNEQRNSPTDRLWSLIPPIEQRNGAIEHEDSESYSPSRRSWTSDSDESLSVPHDILTPQISPLTSRSNLIPPPRTTVHSNPSEDQHDDGPRGTSCKEAICCIIV